MDAIKKQASKLREQVAKQQQAVLKQFSGRFAIDPSLLEEPDAECHQQLQRLFKSTKAAKHFQRDILRGLEGLIAESSSQMEIVSNLANSCVRFGENAHSDPFLAEASLRFCNSHRLMEEEREKLIEVLAGKVYEPLRSVVMAAPLEDARHLAHCYEKLRQEVEAQALDVARRKLRSNEAENNPSYLPKLWNSEKRLGEVASALTALGREATSAMKSVATHQRNITFQQLLLLVEAERSYHHNVASLLDTLHDELMLEKQKNELEMLPDSCTIKQDVRENQEINGRAQFEIRPAPAEADESCDVAAIESREANDEIEAGRSPVSLGDPEIERKESEKAGYFIAEVVHSFDAMGDGELDLSIGDFVVVRQESDSGWWEGECKGMAGWFPAAYVERCDRAPALCVVDPSDSTTISLTPPPPSSSSSS